MATVEEMEALLASRKADREKAKADQYAKDLEAYAALDEEHGGGVARVCVSVFKQGQPTFAVLRMPSGVEYKRYVDQVNRAAEKKNVKATRDAAELLAKACWVYPKEKEAQESMLEEFPGLLTSMAIAASSLAEGKAEDEGKG